LKRTASAGIEIRLNRGDKANKSVVETKAEIGLPWAVMQQETGKMCAARKGVENEAADIR
jgi:hypothetical protein